MLIMCCLVSFSVQSPLDQMGTGTIATIIIILVDPTVPR